MDKIISFSLWGDSKLYCQGAIDNVICAKEHYPDWKCRFYIARNCPALPDLEKLDCELVVMPCDFNTIDKNNNRSNPHNLGMLWRFLAISDPNVERVIFRDTDSRVSAREAAAVAEWEQSDHLMHRIHECSAHWNVPVMGGMWGLKGGLISNIEDLLRDYLYDYQFKLNEHRHWFVIDLYFIIDILWPYFKNSCMGHGFNHPSPLTVDGPMVGGVVHEEWRDVKYA